MRARLALCYPRHTVDCWKVVQELEASGISKICFAGDVVLHNGVRVLGKGHSSVVAAAQTRDGRVVAIKVLRTDAKRGSLLGECRLLRWASVHGASPAPHECSERFIVMSLVWGRSLMSLVEESMLTARHIVEALEAAYALDNAGILHLELHRPWRNIYYPYRSVKALIIDLESAKEGCGNVPRVAQALYVRLIGKPTGELLELLKGYKDHCSRHYYNEIVKELVGVVRPAV